MKQYDSYKDSGVEWIGKIPSHWEVVKLKYDFDIYAGATPKTEVNEYWDGDITWITPADYKTEDKYITSGQRTITKEGYNSCNTQIVPKGCLIFSKRAPIGTVAVSGVDLCTNQGCLSCVPRNTNVLYFYYLTSVLTEVFDLFGSGATFKEISADTFANFRLPCPSIEEQEAIANYLDKKCGEIDKAIATQEKRVELLKELRQNIITQAVTRGINPNAPLKDSGVEWIGEVPEHWEIKRIKHVINLLTDYDANGSFADIAKNCKVNEGEPYAWMVRATDLENKRYGIVDGNNYCDLSTYKYLAKSSLKANDILIAKRGEIGKSYLVPQCEDPMTLAPNTYLLLTKKDVIDNIFFFNYLQSCGGVENLRILNKSTTLGALYKDDVKAMQIPVPHLSEQREIVSYIESKTARLDASIDKAEHQIELLQELKQSIITEVVTGKRKVC
ncbi:MAG: restriction endonuclease subunit S [Prevotella sp.]|nr:restriction endonuclease subunit S [Prevotella sp.]